MDDRLAADDFCTHKWLIFTRRWRTSSIRAGCSTPADEDTMAGFFLDGQRETINARQGRRPPGLSSIPRLFLGEARRAGEAVDADWANDGFAASDYEIIDKPLNISWHLDIV